MSKFDPRDAQFLRSITKGEDAPLPPKPSVIFAGRSNVGKSTLINALTRQKGLARTSNTPGRTQSIIYFEVSGKYYFIDLPGYGYAKAPLKVRAAWGPMVEKFLAGSENVRLALVLLDMRHDPTRDDRQLVSWLQDQGLAYIFVLTKADKLRPAQVAGRIKEIQEALELQDDSALLPFSSTTSLGRDALLHVIQSALEGREAPAVPHDD